MTHECGIDVLKLTARTPIDSQGISCEVEFDKSAKTWINVSCEQRAMMIRNGSGGGGGGGGGGDCSRLSSSGSRAN